MFTSTEDAWGCIEIFAPDGTSVCFLQGDEASDLSKQLVKARKVKMPSGPFATSDELVSELLSQYESEECSLWAA